jgi:DNA-binding transcriptional LysR family regulator
VAIGATPSLSATLLPSILGPFHSRYPGVGLTVTEQGSRPLVDGIESGALDLALAILPWHRPALQTVALAIEELVVVTALGHPLARRRRIDIAQLAQVPMVMFRDGYDLRTATLGAFRDVGLEPTVAVEGGELGSVLALVAAGVGAAIIPSIVAADPRLHALRLGAPTLTREIGLIRHVDRQPSRAADALGAGIVALLSEHGWPGHVPAGLRLQRG